MADGTQKVLEKLKASLAEGRPYEAHQMYRSVCQRYASRGKHEEALQLLHSGAIALLAADQPGSATDLGQLLFEVSSSAKEKVDDVARERIIAIFEAYGKESTERATFVKGALRWSTRAGAPSSGDAVLRHTFGLVYWKERNYQEAEKNLLYGVPNSARALGKIVRETAKNEGKTIDAVRVARLVLKFLCIGDIRNAHIFLETALTEEPAISGEQHAFFNSTSEGTKSMQIVRTEYPLLNFAQLLLITVQRDAYPLFKSLREKYQQELQADPSFGQYLEKIAEVYYNVAPPRSSNPFGDLFSNLLAGGNDL